MKKLFFLIIILFIYSLNTAFAQWTQVSSDIDGEAADDKAGYSVSISPDGKRVAIGAPWNAGTNTDAGHVRVYSESGGEWTQVGSDIDGEAAYDYSGHSVSLSSDGSRVAIGAPFNDGTANNAGHVRVYSESGGAWTQIGNDIDGEAGSAFGGDESGRSVSLSFDGKRVAIGAPYNDGGEFGAGHVRVYSESGGAWTQVGSDIDGEAKYDDSGNSVSLSSDGKRVAIGAPGTDGGGSNAGQVKIYSESGGVWTQVGSDINGEAAGDESGWSVSLSSDAIRVAIGAPVNNNNTGHVRVYIYENALSLADNEIFDLIPTRFTVLPAYPNPFNPSTTITYGIDTDSKVSIQLYNISGQLITTLLNTEQVQGWHSVLWNGTNNNNEQVPAGIYFSKITSNTTTKTTKLMLVK